MKSDNKRSAVLNPAWIDAMQKAVNPCPYFQLQQMRLLELSWGKARVEIELGERHQQPFGVVHGGVYASLMDAAGFWAVYSRTAPHVGMTTVELKINYLAPAVSGRLIGMGTCIKLGRALGLGEARIENENGRLLAHGNTTVMVQPDMHIPGTVVKIPKFESHACAPPRPRPKSGH